MKKKSLLCSHLGGPHRWSSRVRLQSRSVPINVLPFQVTFSTSMPEKGKEERGRVRWMEARTKKRAREGSNERLPHFSAFFSGGGQPLITAGATTTAIYTGGQSHFCCGVLFFLGPPCRSPLHSSAVCTGRVGGRPRRRREILSHFVDRIEGRVSRVIWD